MPTIHVSYIAPVNPPGVSPALSHEQLWKAMNMKVTSPSLFVPAITKCVVHSSEPGLVRRTVTLRTDHGESEIDEDCGLFEPTKIVFSRPDGSSVINLLSPGSDGQLYMAYIFELLETAPEGTAEFETKRAMHQKLAQLAVEKSIQAARNLVIKGNLDSAFS
ncbi:hypothetical protein Cpir12675_000786 [Ceratocystis pirilliformis]|uniref:DUF1857-domain-containing protein n=1 Tax=Ceratocystis pirilliformis TaxID=259994 RepID=A0ABR3ZKK3_9PEZI